MRRCTGTRQAGSSSEVKLVDVIFIKDERRSEQELAAVDQLELAQPTRVKLGVTGFEFAVDNCPHRVDRRVAQIDRIPQDDRLHAAGFVERFHLVRCSKSCNVNLPDKVCLQYCTGFTATLVTDK